jgi:hypothetical protein
VSRDWGDQDGIDITEPSPCRLGYRKWGGFSTGPASLFVVSGRRWSLPKRCDPPNLWTVPWSSGLSDKKSFERACGDSGVASTKRALPRLSLRTWRCCKVPPFSWPAAPAKRKPPFGEAGGLSLLSTGLIRERVRRIRRQRQSSTCDDRHREKPPAVTTSGFELGIRGSV